MERIGCENRHATDVISKPSVGAPSPPPPRDQSVDVASVLLVLRLPEVRDIIPDQG